jgi:hypothetical protein
MRDNDSVLLENAYNKVKDKDASEYTFGISIWKEYRYFMTVVKKNLGIIK